MKDYSDRITKQLISDIQMYPSIYPSHLHVLSHMLLGYGTGYEWINGELIEAYTIPEKKKVPPIPVKYATEIFMYGYQKHQCHFNSWCKEYSPLFHIPENVTKDWLHVIESFIYEINSIDLKSFKIQVLAHYLPTLGLNNPSTYAYYDRTISEFTELRKLTDKICKERGWEHFTTQSLHDPQKKLQRSKETSKMIQEILDEADGMVPGAKQALKKQDAREFIRRYGVDIFKEVIKEMEENKT